MPIQPVFPPGAPAALVDEAAAQAQASALSRRSYLAGLAVDVDFREHLLDGVLKDKETAALALLGTCPEDDVQLRRHEWRVLKDLRENLTNDLKTAQQDVLAAKAGGAAGQS